MNYEATAMQCAEYLCDILKPAPNVLALDSDKVSMPRWLPPMRQLHVTPEAKWLDDAEALAPRWKQMLNALANEAPKGKQFVALPMHPGSVCFLATHKGMALRLMTLDSAANFLRLDICYVV